MELLQPDSDAGPVAADRRRRLGAEDHLRAHRSARRLRAADAHHVDIESRRPVAFNLADQACPRPNAGARGGTLRVVAPRGTTMEERRRGRPERPPHHLLPIVRSVGRLPVCQQEVRRKWLIWY